MSAFGFRRVVTGIDDHGRAVFISDGPAPTIEMPGGFAACDLWWIDHWPTTPADGGDWPDHHQMLEPPAGGIYWRIVRIPPDVEMPHEGREHAAQQHPQFSADRPGFHYTRSIDFLRVIDGHIHMDLDDSTVELRGGDYVVQRGVWHGWRNQAAVPTVTSVVMLQSDNAADHPNAGGPNLGPRGPSSGVGAGGSSVRRLVTGLHEGRSVCVAEGAPAIHVALEHGAGMVYTSMWETMGRPTSALQGGDDPDDRVALHPLRNGASWKLVSLPPERALATVDRAALRDEMARRLPDMSSGGEHDPDRPGWHRTNTIDFVQIISGTITLELDDGVSVDLAPGDCVIQRGTWHSWRNTGDEVCTFSAVLISAP